MSAVTAAPGVGRRAELTFRQNRHHGRHGWLRLTPAYSVELIHGLLKERQGARVLEPFSGSGTTALVAAELGLEAWACDINPFLIWLARAKVSHYAAREIDEARRFGNWLVDAVRRGDVTRCQAPPLRNIERWWTPSRLELLCALKAGIDAAGKSPAQTLLLVAFCRTLMALSNAAFDHQSMSFGTGPAQTPDRDFEQFAVDLDSVLTACAAQPSRHVRVEFADARALHTALPDQRRSFDLLVTSPPYPNRMSYIRELRPYMYWLGFLENGKEAGELDWEAVGGTWGIATSRLLSWKPTGAFIPEYLFQIIEKIRSGHPKNGELMSQYVHKYFDDMFQHFQAAAGIVRKDGSAHYIVGNSTFYGHVVPAERLYVDQLVAAGFRRAEARAIRKRNSKKELVEFHVIAQR